MGHFHHILHRYHLINQHYRELGVLYLARVLKALVLSMSALFVPIYFYELGYSLVAIGGFFAVWFLLRAPFDLLAGVLSARYGPKHIMALGHLVLVAYLLGLLVLGAAAWAFYPVAAIGALYHSFYWVGYHIDFSRVLSKQKSGRELSWLAMGMAVALALGPLIGGLIAANFGITVLFGGVVVAILGIIPLLFATREVVARQSFSLRGYPWRSLPKTGFWLSATEIDLKLINTVWPLFIFLALFSHNPYVGVGAVITAGLALTLGADYIIGRLCDSHSRVRVRQVSAALAVAIHGLRPFAFNLPAVVGINVAGEITGTGISISHMGRHYARAARSSHYGAYIVLNEAFASLFKGIFWVAVVILALLFSELVALQLAFAVGILLMLPLVLDRKGRV